ncbi:LuxR family transcriptional regulator [Aminobacter anthyllidis]|uniref:helix-turn-helix transcriptional regulator n=1 Tax=Aminobacter anthyllidis TaxID=1035067 RepID=UPI0024564AE4|nr:LuxR family transcriptional regulator [Aminobacter anthyllidis]MDH4989129.1 LuxR family transcriptional regulator [Aminobacter anthyllidis]
MNLKVFASLTGALARIDAAINPAEVLEELLNILRPFGFRHLLITGLPPPQVGPWQREILYDGWPVEWLEHYLASEHFSQDPCASRSRLVGQPFIWRDLTSNEMTTGQLRVMGEAAEFGLRDGFCVPVHEPRRAPSVVTAAGERIELLPEDVPILETVCVHAYRALRRLNGGGGQSPQINLTDRERQVLTWIAAGKVAEDVACILGISRFTVERHLSNVREKCDAVNTIQAAMEAVRRGEISP